MHRTIVKKLAFGFTLATLLMSIAAAASAQPPGAPLAGASFSTTIKELVDPTPAATAPSVSGPFLLPTTVEQGFVVLIESAALPPTDPHNWSDVVDFTTHQAARQAFLVSDPQEQGISDADLAP